MNLPTLTILMVDDSEDDFLLTSDLLEYARLARFMVTWASTFEQGLDALGASTYDAVLVDFRMDSKNGFDFLAAATEQGVDIPFIFLTGQQGHEIEMAALRHGADDYLPKKDLSPSFLERTILHAIERRRLMASMKRSEALFRSLFEDTRIGMVLLTPDGRIAEINEVALRLLAIPSKDAIADVGDLFPQDAEKARKAFAAIAVASPSEAHYFRGGEQGDGWLQATFSPVADYEGTDIGAPVVMIVRDISREMAMTLERDLLATFPEQNPQPVLRVDTHGICDYANQKASELLCDWNIGQGRPLPAPLTLAAQEAYEKSRPQEIERTVGGRTFVFILAPIQNFQRIYIYGRDITEEKQAVGRIRRAALVFDNTDDGVMITDGQGIIRTVNAAYTRITGYPDTESTGKTPSLMKSERHDAPFYKGLWRSLLEQGSWEGEIWNRRKNGELYLQHSRISAVYDDAGSITEFVSIFNDVTGARRRAEDLERQAYHDPLTGLPNRLLFQDRIAMAISRSDRNATSFALLYLDLDGFKEVNDRSGHLAGDRILQWVAEHIGHAIRGEDTLARLGGDEFVVIAEAPVDRESLDDLSQRIHGLFAEGIVIDGLSHPVSTSIGVAFYPKNASESQELIKKADEAMYQAKLAGKQTTRYATDAP